MAKDRLRRSRKVSDPGRAFIRESMTSPLVLNRIGAAKRMKRSVTEAARKAIIERADFRKKFNSRKIPDLQNLRAVQQAVNARRVLSRHHEAIYQGKVSRPRGHPHALGIDRAKLRDAIVAGREKGLKGEKLKAAARARYNNPNVRGLAEPNIGAGPKVREVLRYGGQHRVLLEPPPKRGRRSYVAKQAKTDVSASRSEAARKAWETIRARRGLKAP